MRLLLFVAFTVALLAPSGSIALDADEMFTDPAKEARAREIGRQLRCPKCRNQSIFDSNASIAKDLRVVVRERMVAGDSDEEILDYVHARFGDFVLLNPKVSGQNAVLWFAPIVLLTVSVIAMASYLHGRKKPERSDDLSEDESLEAQSLLRGTEG